MIDFDPGLRLDCVIGCVFTVFFNCSLTEGKMKEIFKYLMGLKREEEKKGG